MNCHVFGQKRILSILAISMSILCGCLAIDFQAFAQESGTESTASDSGSKLIGAGMAFGLAAAGAGIGLGFVGAAGLAAISDNPKMQSRVFIFVGMVESIAIYGIVMMFIILGQ
jgi:V/A-type H+/Na+-transporting ATPase subunit K